MSGKDKPSAGSTVDAVDREVRVGPLLLDDCGRKFLLQRYRESLAQVKIQPAFLVAFALDLSEVDGVSVHDLLPSLPFSVQIHDELLSVVASIADDEWFDGEVLPTLEVVWDNDKRPHAVEIHPFPFVDGKFEGLLVVKLEVEVGS